LKRLLILLAVVMISPPAYAKTGNFLPMLMSFSLAFLRCCSPRSSGLPS
jgi:hypothetical protein